MTDFVHLHLHTEYSLLDGACRISEIASAAKEDGQRAVAITDHGVMYGAVEFYNSLKKEGLKPIIGCEVYVAPRSRFLKEGKGDSSGHHLILLVKNKVGYKNLCYMVSESFVNGFYMRPRIDMELLRSHAEGLVCLSGCLGGKIPEMILSGNMEGATEAAREFFSIFGDDFYLEIQNHHLDDEKKVAFGISLISKNTGIPMVATNDVHYLKKSDSDIQAALMCIQTGNTLAEGKPFGFQTDDYYFRSAEEMRVLFSSFPGAIENTVKIAEKCSFDFEYGTYYLPTFTPENGRTHKEELLLCATEGFRARKEAGGFRFDLHTEKEYEERLRYELSVIDQMGFNAYFLIVSDFVQYAKDHGIPVGPGRGSGAGSLVAYCIRITEVDPLQFDLLFERFLNPERVSMPDFDIDFCDEKREEVIAYVKRKYGEDKVAQIVTFGTLAAKAAVRDVGRVLGMPYAQVDSVAKLIPRAPGVTLEDALKSKELLDLYQSDSAVKKLLDIAKRIEGMPRHASMHAAGVVITEKPTYEYVPLSGSAGNVVTQFDMNTVAKLGLVKFDFLGLRYLSVIDDAQSLIRRDVPDFRIDTVSLSDEKTFSLLCSGRTNGVFQLESGGMKQVLMRLAPKSLEDIIACIALYRPGPMDSIDDFIDRAHGRSETSYKIPALAPILDVTHGCIVYQEQVMQIFRELAGYSFAQADLVRRAMAKKNEAQLLAEKEKFVLGCKERGIAEADALEIFAQMASFASYAFNKSHATAYGLLSYRTAYLKAHYPAQYFAALMSSVLSTPEKIAVYISDSAKNGVKVLPPDICESESDFSVCDEKIRFGLLAVRNVGRPFAAACVEERKKGRYRSFDDFVHRMKDADLNKKCLENLIKCGAFDSFGITRSALLSSYETIVEAEHQRQRNSISGQLDIFSMALGGGSSPSVEYDYPKIPEFEPRELLLLEKESTGIYFSGHLLDSFSDHIDSIRPDRISDLLECASDASDTAAYHDRSAVKVCGILNGYKTRTVKNGSTMASGRIEDRFGECEVVIFPKQYAKYENILSPDAALCVEGTLSVEEGDETRPSSVRIMLSSAVLLKTNASFSQAKHQEKPVEKRLYVKVASIGEPKLSVLERTSSLHPGAYVVYVYAADSRKTFRYKGLSIAKDEKTEHTLSEKFGEGNVVFQG